MSRLTSNMLANYMAKGWLAALNLLTVPLYVKFMGIESYGLVGFFTTCHAAAIILYEGIYVTLNRELARSAGLPETGVQSRDALRTLEVICWTMAAAISIGFVFLSPLIASHWLNVQDLPTATVSKSISIMAVAFGIELPSYLYMGGLTGLQMLKLKNAIVVTIATSRSAGTLAVLWFVSPSIEAYALSQIPAVITAALAGAYFLYRALPKIDRRARFKKSYVQSVWRFYLGAGIAAALASLLLQTDKIVLSKMLPLNIFGYYSLASVLALNLAQLVVDPACEAVFPQFSYLVKMDKTSALTELFHGACQAVSAMLIPAAATVALFANDVVFAWTRNAIISERTAPILRLLVIGMALRGLTMIPKNLQLAYGWTRLLIVMNSAALGSFALLVAALTRHYGMIGAGYALICLWGVYAVVLIRLMHGRILIGEQASWFVNDVGLPLVATLGVTAMSLLVSPLDLSFVSPSLLPVAVMGLCILTAVIAAPQMRSWFVRLVAQLWIGARR